MLLRSVRIYRTKWNCTQDFMQRLEILEAEMDHMDQICTEMRQKLDAASAETANMVEQAHALQEKRYF